MFRYIALLATTLVALANGQCKVYLRVFSDNVPVLLNDRYQPIDPSPVLHWSRGETAIIACPGSKIVNTRTLVETITCFIGTTFMLGGQYVDIADMECERYSPTVQSIPQPCGVSSQNSQLRLGYQIHNNWFADYILSCYNMQTASVVYTRHIYPGEAVTHSSPYHPSFKKDGLPNGLDTDAFTLREQQNRFNNLLGVATRTGSIWELQRGHITPAGDGILKQFKAATYFYVNVAPQWKLINVGNWRSVEDNVRRVSEHRKESMLIYNGVHDILTLPHSVNRQPVQIWLKNNMFPVPNWFWKIVKSSRSNVAIAFITFNNPFGPSENEHFQMPCHDICAQHGWPNANFAIFERGFTYCCTVEELRRAIPSIPNEATAAGVLDVS